jgi:hypothetical protein
MFNITTTSISTQGHFDKASDRIVALATQGHFLFLVNILAQSISITRYGGGVTIEKANDN